MRANNNHERKAEVLKKTVAEAEFLGATESVCPVCLSPISADRVRIDDEIYLRKSCPEHGRFQTILWRGMDLYREWAKKRLVPSPPPAPSGGVEKGCPYDCGLCKEHRQHTCCVILEVTQRCNLRCPICFAAADGAVKQDPTLYEIDAWCEALLRSGGPYNIQLSGGEPTLRDDLAEIIRLVRERGFSFQQLNTNGLRLAAEQEYAQRLKDAGLGCVFLQFDGVTDDVYIETRGRALLQTKLQAIRNCADAELGVVLVPTLVPGVNTAQIGEILRFAIENAPAVRAVHFQPISYFGRYPSAPRDEHRITLPEVMRSIETQTNGLFKVQDFYPAAGENAFCEFHGKFWIGEGGRIVPAERPMTACCAPPVESGLVQLGAAKTGNGEGARAARKFVAQHWSYPLTGDGANSGDGLDFSSLDAFLAEHAKSFCISGMAFQDAWNLDLERLRECFLHVFSPDQKLVPLCAYNLSSADGRTIYRKMSERGSK